MCPPSARGPGHALEEGEGHKACQPRLEQGQHRHAVEVVQRLHRAPLLEQLHPPQGVAAPARHPMAYPSDTGGPAPRPRPWGGRHGGRVRCDPVSGLWLRRPRERQPPGRGLAHRGEVDGAADGEVDDLRARHTDRGVAIVHHPSKRFESAWREKKRGLESKPKKNRLKSIKTRKVQLDTA